jgi:SPP1 gp7 family putative phage head morphogenesis protein
MGKRKRKKNVNALNFARDDMGKGIPTSEVTSSRSTMYFPSQFEPYNPDELYRKRGNFDIYDKMRKDDQIRSILMVKKGSVLNSGWNIVIDDQVPIHEEIRDDILKWLEDDIEISFDQSMREMLTNLDYGFSITEPVWKIDDGNVKLKYLKTRAPHSFRIFTDEKGNVDKIEQDGETGVIKINPSKVILFPHQMEFGNWYGKSDLESAYRSWWSKDLIIKFWNIYLEKYGSPTAIGKYGVSATQEDKDQLLKVLKTIQTSTSIIIPEDALVELLEENKSGASGDGFESAIDKYNMMISRSMGIPDLLGIGGSETDGGSFALGKNQFEMFFMIIEDIRKDLTRIINRQIIIPMVDANWAIGNAPYPKFAFNPLNAEQRFEMLKSWVEIVKGAGYKPSDEEINWARDIVGAPIGDVEFKESSTGIPFEGKKQSSDQIQDPKPKKDPKDVDGVEKKQAEDEKQMALGPVRKPNMAEKKVNFKDVSARLETTEDENIIKLGSSISIIRENLINAVEKGRWIENKRLDKIDNLKLKGTNNFKMGVKGMLREFNKLGVRDAKDLFITQNFIDVDLETITDDILNAQPVFITDLVNEDILSKAKLTLKGAITEGASVKSAVRQLNEIFEDYDPSFDGHRLENIVRTNGLKAYNQTKQAYFEPFVSSGDIVAFQYSAIIDSRTTDFCFDHDGKVYLADSPYLATIEPPNHFQCRSTMIPITKIEFEEDEIFGATKEENDGFFKGGKFQESRTFGDRYKQNPGGFWTKKKNN